MNSYPIEIDGGVPSINARLHELEGSSVHCGEEKSFDFLSWDQEPRP
jgi:hypothetical protein